MKRKDLFMVICTNFILEFFSPSFIISYIDIKILRCLGILIICTLIVCAKPEEKKLDDLLQRHLNSTRMKRIVKKAMEDIDEWKN